MEKLQHTDGLIEVERGKDISVEEEKERDQMQELVNMMRVYLNVDQNGALIGKKDINGKPIYPTQKDYEQALNGIEKLQKIVKQEKIKEKLISNLHKIILLGGKKFIEFLDTDFKNQKKGIEEIIKEMIENDPTLQLEELKDKGKKYGENEIKLGQIRKAEEIEEKAYEGF